MMASRCSVQDPGSTSGRLSWLLVLLLLSTASLAHEARPAHLEIREGAAGRLDVNWTRPLREERVLDIEPLFPPACRPQGATAAYQFQGLLHERWSLDCGKTGLDGTSISIAGLERVISDVLLRYQKGEGEWHVAVLDRDHPAFAVPGAEAAPASTGRYYFQLGVKHILGGIDHLLFILGLLLLIRGIWNLVGTITAFTLAHSLSLGAAILGYVHLPTAPVEAVIALSIVFLACELRGRDRDTLCKRLPWLIAAVFGLVHGLGFAGALSEIGLPEDAIPLALFMFNIGVEAGQLLFVGVALVLLQGLYHFRALWRRRVELASAYGIGAVAAFWLVERVSGFY